MDCDFCDWVSYAKASSVKCEDVDYCTPQSKIFKYNNA